MEAANLLLPEVPPGENELPSEFGPPMESDQHRSQMEILVESLRLHWKDRDDAYVAGNMALYWSELQTRKNDFLGPDVFVVLDTTKRIRKSWVVWQEEATPDVVIELLSPSTEEKDRGSKKDVYARVLHVPEYFLYDPWDGRFEGYRLENGRRRYVAMEREPDGGYTSALLGLRLAPHPQIFLGEPWLCLRWWTLDGALVPMAEELAEAERARAVAAETRAMSAEARAEALAARLRALGVDPEL